MHFFYIPPWEKVWKRSPRIFFWPRNLLHERYNAIYRDFSVNPTMLLGVKVKKK